MSQKMNSLTLQDKTSVMKIKVPIKEKIAAAYIDNSDLKNFSAYQSHLTSIAYIRKKSKNQSIQTNINRNTIIIFTTDITTLNEKYNSI